ncbi:MAG TPA: hypothetical protein VKB46_25640 [Pyrinomonadaceae bacterium]|nr:hypothetical protein [Pyrinomonadaceae bacterium]
MSDGETLLLILSLFYLSDCFLWIKKQSVAFLAPWCQRWHIAIMHTMVGNSRGGFLLANPLPPFGTVILAHVAPISISPAGVCAFNLQTLPAGRTAQTGHSLLFADVTAASTDGLDLVINNERFAKCATGTQARMLSDLINEMTTTAPGDREELLRAHLSKQFADSEASARLAEAEEIISPIREMCLILFLLLFLLTPILSDLAGVLRLIIPVGLVMIALAVEIAIMFRRAHRQFYPHETQERFESIVKMILCPPVAIRAVDELSRNLLSHYNPVVLADMLTGEAAGSFVRSYILDLQHPLRHEITDETSVQIMNWATAEQLRLCLEFVDRSQHTKADELLARPEKQRESASYCPRCSCQFVLHAGACPDCPGVGLVAFSE